MKQYSKVTYLRFIFDKSLPGKSMALHVLSKLNFRFLNKPLLRLLRNLMMEFFLSALALYDALGMEHQ